MRPHCAGRYLMIPRRPTGPQQPRPPRYGLTRVTPLPNGWALVENLGDVLTDADGARRLLSALNGL